MDARSPAADLPAQFARFRAGDMDALAAIFDSTAPGLFRSALHLAPDAAAAEDAVQETFLAFLEAVRGGAEIREVGPWLAGTLRNKVLRGRRTARRVPDPSRLAAPAAADDPAALASTAEEVERVHRALDDLPETYREVAVLRWRYGMEPSAIAHARGVAPGTVRSLLSRAAERLRVGLGALGIGFIGMRPQRGLEAVRAHVLHAARVAPPIAAGSAAAALGGALMVKKLVVAAVLLLVLLVGGWVAATRIAGTKESVVAQTPTPPAASAQAHARQHAETGTAVPEPIAAPAGPSVRPAFPPTSPAGELVVHVRWKDDGTPAVLVWVKVHAWDGPDPFLHMLRERTGDDGVVTFPAVHIGNVDVRAESGGLVLTTVEEGARREVELRIPRGITVEGLVVDEKGVPVADAVVADRGREIATTGPDGSFRASVGKGASVGARAPGRIPSTKYGAVADDGAVLHVRLQLRGAGGAVAGRVLDPEGHPLAGALVRMRPSNWWQATTLEDGTAAMRQDWFMTSTDDQGRFRIEGMEPGPTIVQARAPRLAPGQSQTTVVAGKTAEVDVRLAAGGVVTGVAKDGDGHVVPGALVLIDTYGEFLNPQTRTAADGTYRLDGFTLPLGEFEIRAEAENKGAASARLRIESGRETHWDPVFTQGLVTSGRVLDAAGRPREKFLVWMASMDEQFGWNGSAVTDSDGRFAVANCPGDFLRVLVSANATGGKWPLYPSVVRTNVRPGISDLDITVEESQLPSAFLVGKVLGSDGRPVEGANVQVRHPDVPTMPYNFADPATGAFRIGPLPPADYDVTILAKGFPNVALGKRTVARDEEVDLGTISFVVGGSVEVATTREGGAATKGPCFGEVFTAEGASAGYLTSNGNVARGGPFVPGRYRVRVQESSSARGEAYIGFVTVDVRAGEKVHADAVLAAAGMRVLRATLADGSEPKDEVRVRIRDASGAAVADSTTRFTPERIFDAAFPLGSYVVEMTTRAGLTATARFDVGVAGPSGDAVVLTLR